LGWFGSTFPKGGKKIEMDLQKISVRILLRDAP
jgi:hypothetical protein